MKTTLFAVSMFVCVTTFGQAPAEVIKQKSVQFTYDARNRITERKTPGSDWTSIVYDDRDRIVLTQDGNQRGKNQWSFTKYDDLNRSVLTGVYDTVALSRDQMQNVVDNFYLRNSKRGEVLSGEIHGYTSRTFPVIIRSENILTVKYYDSYAFKSSINDSVMFTFRSDQLSNQESAPRVRTRGLTTGSKVRLLGLRDTWLTSVYYYDSNQRLLQSVSDNCKGGVDLVTTNYDARGNVVESVVSHSQYDPTWMDKVNVIETGIGLEKAGKKNAWDAGAFSVSPIDLNADGWMEVTVDANGGRRAIGFNNANTSTGFEEMEFAFLIDGSILQIVESGRYVYRYPAVLNVGDVLRVHRVSSLIHYEINSTIIYTSRDVSSGQLFIDVALFSPESGFTKIRSSAGHTTEIVKTRNTYDHSHRLVRGYHKVNDEPEVESLYNTYNELGQLVSQGLHSTGHDRYIQTSDARFNIRGWLKSVNSPEASADNGALFGMAVNYNEPASVFSQQPRFDGNISSTNWYIVDQQTIQHQTFQYDQMKRLTGNRYFGSIGSSYGESVLEERSIQYDFDGNLKALTRFGSLKIADSLAYTYSNKGPSTGRLINVQDYANPSTGFVDVQSKGDDFGYDKNGNLSRDRNRGMNKLSAITYNILNLPETVMTDQTKIQYVYDANGNKLCKVISTPNFNRVSHYVGEFTYEGDSLMSITTDEGRAVMRKTAHSQHVISHYTLDSSAMDSYRRNHGIWTGRAVADRNGKPNGALQLDGVDDYISIADNQSLSFNAEDFRVSFWVKKLASSAKWDNSAGIGKWNSSSTTIQNSWAVTIGGASNNKPSFSVAVGNTVYSATSDEGIELNKWYKIEAAKENNLLRLYINDTLVASELLPSSTVSVNTSQLPVYIGRFGSGLFSNAVFDDVTFSLLQTSSERRAEYQYFIKDHAGNIRVTFTSKPESRSVTATLEESSRREELKEFLYADEVKRVYSSLFDHTNGTLPGMSMRLNGSSNERIGLAKSIKVMPGDTIRLEVYAKFIGHDTKLPAGVLSTLMSQMVQGGTSPGEVKSMTSQTARLPFQVLKNEESGIAPRAYLNYIMYDRNFVPVMTQGQSGYVRVSEAAKETGEDQDHERLSVLIVVQQPGYLFTYLSNEEEAPVDVYFDDFTVKVNESYIVELKDYLPFGMIFNYFKRDGRDRNPIGYAGKELLDDAGLNWIDFGARIYDPAAARWLSPDPKADQYPGVSPYSYSLNNPVNVIDPDGRDIYLLIWFSKNREVGHAGIAIDNYKDVQKLDANGNPVFDTQGNPVMEKVKDGTMTYYDLWPANTVSKRQALKDVNPDYSRGIKINSLSDLLTKDPTNQRSGSVSAEGRKAEGVVQIPTNYANDMAAKQTAEDEISANRPYNGCYNNCSTYAQRVLNSGLTIPIDASASVSDDILYSFFEAVSPNNLYNEAMKIMGATNLRGPQRVVARPFLEYLRN